MQLGQAQPVGVLHDEGVDIGDVDAGFDDGGAHQHVRFPVHHGLHDGRKFLLTHFSVANHHPHLRPQQLLDPGGRQVNGLHPVVKIVDLAAPGQLLPHGVFQNGPVVLQNIGLYRLAVGGRLLNSAHIPQAGEGHVQRPGDGGGG